ncbi:MAG: polyprenyl synthetase family protein [Myxococcaceae bacterium]
MSFALDGYLSQQRKRVETLLEASLHSQAQRVPPRLLEAMRYSLMAGGKRLRPILVLAFAEAMAQQSGGGGQVANDAACAVEYIHTYSLIHDDLPSMDDDDLRRGMPTSHKKFGEATAILAGDALLTEAFSLLTSGVEPQRLALCRELSLGAGAGGMVAGQVLDIAEDRPAEVSYLTRMHRLKTGALIRAACRMGVLALNGGDPKALSCADEYGDAVGLAFQIADDILDVTASSAAMGKPTGADAAAGRHTYPAVLGLDASKKLARETVERAMNVVRAVEPTPGPLAALAAYSVERVA